MTSQTPNQGKEFIPVETAGKKKKEVEKSEHGHEEEMLDSKKIHPKKKEMMIRAIQIMNQRNAQMLQQLQNVI